MARTGFVNLWRRDLEQSVIEPLQLQLNAINELRDRFVVRDDLRSYFVKSKRSFDKILKKSKLSGTAKFAEAKENFEQVRGELDNVTRSLFHDMNALYEHRIEVLWGYLSR